jgi:hypothetical protein
MEDPQRKPGERDRSPLVARIKRAAELGRIGAADRDIRLGNVASAQTMTELDLMSRELDQLEATLPSAPAAAATWVGPTPPPVADKITDQAVDAAKSTARSIGVVTLVIVVLVLAGAGVAGLVAFRSSSGSSGPSVVLQDPSPISPSTDTSPGPGQVDDTGTATPGGSTYALTGRGIRSFLARYQERFHTTEVVDLTMYGDYVVAQVPVPGKARHEGWLYRNDSGFTSFGGVTANFPGAVPVDTRRLAIDPLLRNIARARATLGVEDPTTTYVIVRFYRGGDEVPSVDIHVSNDFHESGYLATRLDGTVERAYPYSP